MLTFLIYIKFTLGIFLEASGPIERVKDHIMDMYTQAHKKLTNQSVSQVVLSTEYTSILAYLKEIIQIHCFLLQ